jgi:beta-1,4-mannosyl-glycoprotein beta-1,4-N-acetylglucosaminyltransferase
MRIFDCFIFNHEIELLEIRLNVLNDYVDKFVITEGNLTFSGKLKQSYFLQNKDKFSKWEDKIVLNQIEIPSFESPWEREIYSRNSVMNLDIFRDDDLILTSDSDEIPNPEVLKYASEWLNDNTHFTFQQSGYHGYLNNLYTDVWFGTRAATYKYMKNTTVDDIREGTENESKIFGSIITNAGWHFSYCGDENHIKQKINSFCDTQFDVPEVVDNVIDNLKRGKDVLNRSHINYRKVNIDESFPDYIINNQEKYAHLLMK